MANSYGWTEKTLETWGRSIQLSADGQPTWKSGGVTFDWTTVPAIAGADVIYEDGVEVKIGEKALRYGSVVYRMADGRYGLATDVTPAALERGRTFLVNETILESDRTSAHFGVFEAGRVFRDRMLVGAAGQPTRAAVEAAMPQIRYAEN
jgi:hypothetical protein